MHPLLLVAPRPAFREIVYRLRPRDGTATELPLPLVLARGLASVVVETRAAHQDAAGRVWRILAVRGAPPELREAEARFRGYRRPFVEERNVLGRTRTHVFLWYKYRTRHAPFSHTAHAFRVLGRDTLVADETRHGTLTIRLLARSGASLRRFLRDVRQRASPRFRFELLYAGPPRPLGAPRLAQEQEAALEAARRLGYYDVPRRSGLREVGRVLGISTSAAGYRLRRAQARLVEAWLGPKP